MKGNTPVQLNKELTSCNYEALKFHNHLDTIRRYARNRPQFKWQQLVQEIVNKYKSNHDITRQKRIHARANNTSPHQAQPDGNYLTPPGLDYRRTNLQQLGSPFLRQNPTPVRSHRTRSMAGSPNFRRQTNS